MKLKKLLSIIGLGLFAVVSATAGVALANKKVEQVKADDPKTWMFRAQLNLGVGSPSSESCVIEPEHAIDGVKFHFWGENVDTTLTAEFVGTHTYDFYAVNVALADNQVITGAQWIFHQKDIADDKYSLDIHKFGSESNSSLDKDMTYFGLEWMFDNNWTDGKWHFVNDNEKGYTLDSLFVHPEDRSNYAFEKDPVGARFIARNVQCTNGDWVEMANTGSMVVQSLFYQMAKKDINEEYVGTGSAQWFYMLKTGVFDFIMFNSASRNIQSSSITTSCFSN